MLEIDGSEHSGSGTIVRDAIPFCILTGQEIHLRNIRAKRDNPSLRPQHLKALEAAASLCGGQLEGGSVGSKEIWFYPGKAIKGGAFNWDIGTAGSTAMLALSPASRPLCRGPLNLHNDRRPVSGLCTFPVSLQARSASHCAKDGR